MATEKHPLWATSHKRPGTELRLIRGKYYLYEYRTVYDKERKRPKKISGKLIGRITEQGLVPSGKRQLELTNEPVVEVNPSCKEFGVSLLVVNTFAKYAAVLQKNFPKHWKSILSIAYCRFVYHCPLKNIPFRLTQSFLPELIGGVPFNEKTSSLVLKTVGGMHDQMLAYMKAFIKRDDYLMMDSTHIFSNSSLITLSRQGYNSQMDFDPQFNLLYIYSAKTQMPVYYRILPGNIREVKAFKNCLLEAGLDDAVIVADKGFFSKKNIELLEKEALKYILPLKRDNTIIDYELLDNNSFKEEALYFEHEKRFIWYQKYLYGNLSLFLFLDEALKVKEEKDYLRRIETHPESYSLSGYHKKRNTFGTIALLTNFTRKPAVAVFEMYKSRMTIEVLFDGMKNVLEADHTYMQNEQTLQGWMFINHINLQWYQHLYIELKKKNLLKRYSVNDYVQMLTDLKKIKINGTWHFAEITNQSQRMIEKLGLSYN